MLGPIVTHAGTGGVRIPIRDLSTMATPGISSGQLVLLLNEHFTWVRRFSARDMVELEDLSLFRAVLVLVSGKPDIQEMLMLSLSFRIAHEIGWMANADLASINAVVQGFPAEFHTRRCFVEVERLVGVAWYALFLPREDGDGLIVKSLQDVIIDSIPAPTTPLLQLESRFNLSYLADSLPIPRGVFFSDWRAYTNVHSRLQQRGLNNIIKPGRVLGRRWNLRQPAFLAKDFFSFPLFHFDLPDAVNYAGAGRLIADELLREEPWTFSHFNENKLKTIEKFRHNVDTKALLASLAAYRIGTEAKAKQATRKNSQTSNKLFFFASCYALCSSAGNVVSPYGPAKDRCNFPLYSLSEFLATFGCGPFFRKKSLIPKS